MQFLIYMFIGGVAALVNLVTFLAFMDAGLSLSISAPLAFAVAAAANYFLCVALLFRHKARWNSATEIFVYGVVVIVAGALDLGVTRMLYTLGNSAWLSKSIASLMGLVFNFLGRRFWVFPEKRS
jgi:dolichol-phosphate mannosyltransferase